MTKRFSILAASASTFALLATAPAFAQDAGDDVIVISATKRNTTLQDTPVAVTVVSSVEIEKANIRDIKDLQSVVPSLVVTTNQNSAQSTFAIRGFGNGANNTGLEPSVGVFVDGVYRSRPSSAIGDLPKLERIEVLSGPQSTLFGKNASAGVVSIVTAKPEFTTNGSVSATYGNFNSIVVKGDVTGPLTETIAYSLFGNYNSQDGTADSFLDGLPGVNDRDRFNVRGQLLWEPSDDLSARLIADYSEIDEICCHVTNIQNGFTADIITSPAFGGAVPNPDDPFAFLDFRDEAGVPVNEIKDYGVSLHVDYDLGFADLTSITAYRENDAFNSGDVDFTTLELVTDTRDNNLKTFTQELRLASTGDGPLGWLIGAHYFNEDVDVANGLDYGDSTRAYLNALGGGFDNLEAASGGLFAPGSFFADEVTTREFFTQENEAFNVFGNIDYKITDRLTATVGVGYVDDTKDVTGRTVNTDPFGNANLTGDFGINVVSAGVIANGAAPIPGVLPDGIPSFMTAFGVAPTPENFAAIGGDPATAPLLQGYLAGVNQFATGTASSPNNPLLALAGFQFQPQFLAFGEGSGNTIEDASSHDTNVDYTFKLAYEFTDSFNAYASYATGYKATSWNLSRDSRPNIANAAELFNAGLVPNNFRLGLNDGTLFSNATPGTLDQADIDVNSPLNTNFLTRFSEPEEAEVFEIGIKTKFDWGFVNLAVFDQSIKNFQTNAFSGTAFVFINAEEQSTQGIELDSLVRFDDNFTGTFSMTVLDPVFDNFVSPLTGDLSGTAPAGIPKLNLSIGGNWDFQLNDRIDGYLRADFEHQESTQIITQFDIEDEVNRLNASVGFNMDNINLSFWARNLTDDQEFQTIFPAVIQSFSDTPTISGYPARPRTYGVTAKYTFGG